MKFAWLFILFWLISGSNLYSQRLTDFRKYTHFVKVQPINISLLRNKPSGYLYRLKDSSVLLISNASRYLPGIDTTLVKISTVEYFTITDLKKKRKSTWIGILSGTAIGFFIGWGTATEPPSTCQALDFSVKCFFPKELKIIGATSIGAISGLALGSLIGNAKITIPIHGNLEAYQRSKEELVKYLMAY